MRRRTLRDAALLLGAFLMGGGGCTTPIEVPPRPGTVPASATWSGGPDGGAWIDCSPKREVFRCVVYDDNLGDIWARGDYRMQPAGPDRSLVYGGFDGETIFLSGNRFLVPVLKKHRP